MALQSVLLPNVDINKHIRGTTTVPRMCVETHSLPRLRPSPTNPRSPVVHRLLSLYCWSRTLSFRREWFAVQRDRSNLPCDNQKVKAANPIFLFYQNWEKEKRGKPSQCAVLRPPPALPQRPGRRMARRVENGTVRGAAGATFARHPARTRPDLWAAVHRRVPDGRNGCDAGQPGTLSSSAWM